MLKHDQLKPYEDLTEGQKDLDRAPIRNLPKLLALANSAIRRAQHISADSARLAGDGAADALSIKAEACKQAGTIPIIDVTLAQPVDLTLARDLQRRGQAIRLILAQPFSVLAQSFPRECLAELVDAPDAAREVIPAPALEQAAETAESAAVLTQANAA